MSMARMLWRLSTLTKALNTTEANKHTCTHTCTHAQMHARMRS